MQSYEIRHFNVTPASRIKHIENGPTSDYGFIKDGLNNVVGIVSSGLSVVEYTYDVWGSSSITRTDDINDISTLNPFRWKSHYYDNETGMYYINGRYYECEVGQFITPDYSSINPLVNGGLNPYGLGVANPLMFGVNPDNYFSALSLYSDIPTPGSGGSTLLHFLKGAGFLSTSAFAIATAVTILTCGVASPLMIGVGVVTGIEGVATAVNGVAEIQEGFTGDNFMRDDIFGGNQTAYNWYSFGTDAVATVGSIWGGAWLKYNQPRIQAYKNVGKAEFPQNYYLEEIGTRPYFDSTLTQKQIIKYGEMTSNVGKNGRLFYTFTANGSFSGTVGFYELTITSNYKYIWHLLFKGVK